MFYSWFLRDVIYRRHVGVPWTKDFSLASIVRDANMAAMSLSFYSLRNEWKPKIRRTVERKHRWSYFMMMTIHSRRSGWTHLIVSRLAAYPERSNYQKQSPTAEIYRPPHRLHGKIIYFVLHNWLAISWNFENTGPWNSSLILLGPMRGSYEGTGLCQRFFIDIFYYISIGANTKVYTPNTPPPTLNPPMNKKQKIYCSREWSRDLNWDNIEAD
jgi:hypothetical protein